MGRKVHMEYYRLAYNMDKEYLNVHHIHPLKQYAISRLIDWTREKFPEVEYIAVFGSTVNGTCRPTSDIDICVWAPEGSKFHTDGSAVYDVIFARDVDRSSSLRRHIEDEGVLVYAKDLDETC